MDSPERRRDRSRSPRRNRSPRNSRSPRRDRSPVRNRSPRRDRSPIRDRNPRRDRSPIRNRSRSPKRNSRRSPSPIRRSRSRSPLQNKRKSPSPTRTKEKSRSPSREREKEKKHKKEKHKDKHKKDKKDKDKKHKKDKHRKKDKHKEKKEKKSKKDKTKEEKESGDEEAVYVEKELVTEKKNEEDYVVGPLPFHMVRRPEAPIEITEEIAMRAADKGLVKHTVRAGEENVYPTTGSRVTVKYTGKFINGKQFDASEKFSFALGKGQVIQGWDLGVAQMALGEKAQLIVGSQCGYGRRGSPPTIPPNCILVFDVELLSIF